MELVVAIGAGVLVLLVAAVVVGILVGRKNKRLVETAMQAAKDPKDFVKRNL